MKQVVNSEPRPWPWASMRASRGHIIERALRYTGIILLHETPIPDDCRYANDLLSDIFMRPEALCMSNEQITLSLTLSLLKPYGMFDTYDRMKPEFLSRGAIEA